MSEIKKTVPAPMLDHEPLVVRSVEKAFRVLEAFDGSYGRLNLSQIAASAGLGKSGAQRFTRTLVQLGYLAKDPVTKYYELTPKALNLGHQYTRASSLVACSTPYMIHLSQTAGETVSLTVLDDTEVVFISRFLSPHMLNTGLLVGSRRPAYCTAPGIAILSALPSNEANSILERSERHPITPNTTWRMADLQAKLVSTRKSGYAIAVEEMFKGDISLAAAIRTSSKVIGAISIGVSKLRYDKELAIETLAPKVIAAANSISCNLKSGPARGVLEIA